MSYDNDDYNDDDGTTKMIHRFRRRRLNTWKLSVGKCFQAGRKNLLLIERKRSKIISDINRSVYFYH